MARIVHVSDLHLDAPDASARDATSQSVDFVLREAADLLLISGDVFDRAADSTGAGRFFAAQMERLATAGIPVLVAAGNHDAACPRATAYPAPVRWFSLHAPETVVLNHLGLAVHGQGLADPAEPRDLTGGFPQPLPGYLNLGVLHTSLDGNASRTICAPTSVARLRAAGYDYWALGHVHQRRVRSTRPWIVYPGSPYSGAALITTVDRAIVDVSHHQLTRRVPVLTGI